MREGLLLQDISFSYDNQWAGDNKPALSHINLSVQPGEFTAIIGPTGSGKTTLIKHLNALLRPGEGNIFFYGRDIWGSSFSRRDLRCKVGLCFQIPDYQFFEETLIRDIAFGPRNMGLPEEECLERARRAMTLMGLPPELETVSPFSLSGGQKRRAAIAGILAMEPEYLVLDEPAAGMDSEGRETLYRILHTLNEDRGITILFVTHDMNDVADHARRVIVMEDGRIRMDGSPRDIFSRREELAGLGLGLPEAAAYYLDHCREEEHFLPLTVSELARILRKRAESRQEDVSKCDIGTIL